MKVEILDTAETELDESIQYYELQQKGLGKRFYFEFKNALSRIVKFPKANQVIISDIRRCLVKTFPYSVIYQIQEDNILIISVTHQHRKPYYWKDRV